MRDACIRSSQATLTLAVCSFPPVRWVMMTEAARVQFCCGAASHHTHHTVSQPWNARPVRSSLPFSRKSFIVDRPSSCPPGHIRAPTVFGLVVGAASLCFLLVSSSWWCCYARPPDTPAHGKKDFLQHDRFSAKANPSSNHTLDVVWHSCPVYRFVRICNDHVAFG
jgi:hypothetical protein